MHANMSGDIEETLNPHHTSTYLMYNQIPNHRATDAGMICMVHRYIGGEVRSVRSELGKSTTQ